MIKHNKKIVKKRKLKRKKLADTKQGFLSFFTEFIQKRSASAMHKIRKEQRHCLRFKKYKNKQTFCFVRALLMQYPWKTMLSFIVLSIIGLFIIVAGVRNSNWDKYFGDSLQTSIIGQLEAQISSLRNQIFDRKKCTEDKYWLDSTGEVCNYWLYQQNNQHCAKFNVNTKRTAIGTKMCCKPLESVVYDGEKKNVVACPGSDIFFSRNTMNDSTLVADASGCGLGVCQFYPAEGYLIKFDVNGDIAMGAEGQPLIVKPCAIKREVGSCDKDCGGGHRTITGQDIYCNQFQMTELCNVEPCFTETVVN